MASNAPLLRLVDEDGVVTEQACPHCKVKEDEIEGLQRDIRGWTKRYADLQRDRAREARESALWPHAVALFDYWRKECKHPRAKFTTDRFELIAPFLESHGLPVCKLAVDGAAHDPYETERRNGTTKKHDGLQLIFRDAEKLEEFCNRASLDRLRAYSVAKEDQARKERDERRGPDSA